MDAFRSARLAACLHATRGHETTPMRLLRARTFLRLCRPLEAHSALRELWLENDVTRGEAAMLQGAAAARLGDSAAAARLLLTARAYVFSSDAPALEAELEYHSALTAFGELDLHQAIAACRRLLHVPPAGGPAHYVIPLRHLRADAFELLGRLRALRGNYAAAAPLAFKALDEFRRSGVRDDFAEAHHVAGAAILVKDLDLADRAPALTSQVEALRWTAETADQRFRSREALGWCAALRGDHVGAFRQFRRAGDDLTFVQQVDLGAARASLAQELEQRIVAAEEIGHALDVAEHSSWQQSSDDELAALVRLAHAAAPLEPARARGALERYAKLSASHAPPEGVPVAERTLAEEAFAEGVVARAHDEPARALAFLRSAFERWSRIGFAWRAARAAIELVELGAAEPYTECVRRELQLRPSSWIAKRAAAALGSH